MTYSKTTQELYDVLGRKLPDECWLLIFMPEDVKEMRPDLSIEQCRRVLSTFNAFPGMTWDQVLGEHANDMFPKEAEKTVVAAIHNWRDLFPEGRQIFYEGDDPEAFVKEIKERFGFDPSQSDKFPEGYLFSGPTWAKDRCFWCPSEYLDEIYGSDKYPMGS